HRADLLALEPARLGQLLRIDRDLLAQRLAQKPHHQARWERPGLAGEIADAADQDARFLVHLAAYPLFQRLARFHEAGEAGEAVARPAPVAAEQRALAADRQHDRDRVGARVVRGLAF